MRVIKGKSHTFRINFGTRSAGNLIKYRYLDSQGLALTSFTDLGLYEVKKGDSTSEGTGNSLLVTILNDENIKAIHSWDTVRLRHIVEEISVEDDFIANSETIKKFLTGRWRIVNNQMIVYDTDKVTPLYTFDLKDESGTGTETDPMERTPV